MRRRSSNGWTRTVRSVAFLAVVAAASWPAAAEGQRRGQMGSRQQDRLEAQARATAQAREVLEARLRVFFAESVKRRLALSDAEMDAVRDALGTFETERRELARQERELRASLGPALGGGDETLSDDEAREILARMAELRMEEARLFRREQDALLETLTPAQLVRLYQLRAALGNRIRMLRGGGPRGPGPGGGGPPPPGPPLFFDFP